MTSLATALPYLLLTALAIAVWRLGHGMPHSIGRERCRKCGFDVRGQLAAHRASTLAACTCPECGNDLLRDGAVVTGGITPRPRLAMLGLTGLLCVVLAFAVRSIEHAVRVAAANAAEANRDRVLLGALGSESLTALERDRLLSEFETRLSSGQLKLEATEWADLAAMLVADAVDFDQGAWRRRQRAIGMLGMLPLIPTFDRATVDAVRVALLDAPPTVVMPTRLRRGVPVDYRILHASFDAENLLIHHVVHSAQTRCGAGGLAIHGPANHGHDERLPTVPKVSSISTEVATIDLDPGEYELVLVVELLALGLCGAEFEIRVGAARHGGGMSSPDPELTTTLHEIGRQAVDRRMHEIVIPITVFDDRHQTD